MGEKSLLKILFVGLKDSEHIISILKICRRILDELNLRATLMHSPLLFVREVLKEMSYDLVIVPIDIYDKFRKTLGEESFDFRIITIDYDCAMSKECLKKRLIEVLDELKN